MFVVGFFRWSFEIAAINFAVIDKVGAIFCDEDFDATGDWNGDNCASEAESVDADSNGGKNNEGRELHAFTLDFWRDDIGFDLKINNGIDKEGDAGAESVEAKQKCDDGAANKTAKHRD